MNQGKHTEAQKLFEKSAAQGHHKAQSKLNEFAEAEREAARKAAIIAEAELASTRFKCTKCGNIGYKWYGCKCPSCGNEEHKWSNDGMGDGICTWCGYDMFKEARRKSDEIKRRAFDNINIGKVLDTASENIRRGNY